MLERRNLAVRYAVASLMVAAGPATAGAQTSAFTGTADTLLLDLPTARQIGLQRSPMVAAALARLDAARGERRQAGVYQYNPRVELKVSSLIDPGDRGTFESIFSQELEWAGQWGLRKSAANHGLAVAEGHGLDAVRLLSHEIDVAYFRAVAAEHRLEVRRLGLELSDRFLAAVQIQRREGKVSTLDVNLAEIEAGRARAGERSARRAVSLARLELAQALGLPPGQAIRVIDESSTGPDPLSLSLDSLLAVALAVRPDLSASEAEVARANASQRLASREAIPNLQVAAVASRGGLEDEVMWGVRVGLPFPLWNRNQGMSDAGKADEARAAAELAATELMVRAEVAAGLESYASAWEELEVFDTQVRQPARSNQGLLETAYVAGRMDLPTALLLRTQLLEAELGYWDTWLAERAAYSALQAAVGNLQEDVRPEF